MKRSHVRLYLPFVGLALAQAAFVLVAPSRGERQALNAGAGGFVDAAGNPVEGGDLGDEQAGGAVDPATGQPTDGPATGGTATTSATAKGGGSTGTVGGGTTGTTGGGSATTAAGDTSHCKNGRQTGFSYQAPPCVPKFVGNNGGATYPGVTATSIKVVLFECQPNEQVNAILATQGLAASQAETDAMAQAVVDVMNKTYELYGRKITFSHTIGDCPLSPPDPAKARQAATEVAKTKPAMVLNLAGGPETLDVFAQNGILSLGGSTQDVKFTAGRRPFRWDVATNGTETADQVAEYYCKKLAKKPADHGGALIHASIGGKSTARKLGVLVPDNGNGAQTPNAARVKQKVEACGGGEVAVFTYSSDISRAAEQTRVVVAGLINAKVTTVACLCDPIAPVFLTTGMTANSYFPEHLLPGAGLLDYDILARLYDKSQWNHAFGPSQLANPVGFADSDASKFWAAAGKQGSPCRSCNLITAYLGMAGLMFQSAGPNLTPLNVEKALVGGRYSRGGWAETKGNPSVSLLRFGPNDYTAVSDFREVYWDANATSSIDGGRGAYVPMNGGRRYALGELGSDFTVPAR